MSYLTEEEMIIIGNDVRLLSIDEIDDISHYSFDSGIDEYNDFLKIAKLFFDLNISKTFVLIHNIKKQCMRKGYGSFMLELARAFAFSMNEVGIACRFLTVDADIEYNSNTPEFYRKKGFTDNLSNKKRNAKHTISMRKDIFQIED